MGQERPESALVGPDRHKNDPDSPRCAVCVCFVGLACVLGCRVRQRVPGVCPMCPCVPCMPNFIATSGSWARQRADSRGPAWPPKAKGLIECSHAKKALLRQLQADASGPCRGRRIAARLDEPRSLPVAPSGSAPSRGAIRAEGPSGRSSGANRRAQTWQRRRQGGR